VRMPGDKYVHALYVYKTHVLLTDDICTLLRFYAASSGNLLPTFWDNVSVPSSRIKNYNESRMLLIQCLNPISLPVDQLKT
jgi:hypothetical protein